LGVSPIQEEEMNNTNEHIKLAELLVKELTGELSDKEMEQLALFEKEEDKKQIATSVRENAFDAERLERYKSFDVEAARKKVGWKVRFQQRSKKRNFTRFIRYAAIIAMPLAMAAYMIFMVDDTQQDMISHVPVEIQPGETKARLYLSDGSTVDLENHSENVIQEKDGSVIEKDVDGLNYQSHSKVNKPIRVAENVMVTPRGGEYNLVLSDGTKVWMNAESEIRYPVQFVGKTRRVKVSGEVYFEVAKDLKKPFIVDVNDVAIKVLGTQFNVCAYPDERNIATTLVEGAVRLSAKELSGNTTTVDLIPGLQADYDRFSKRVETREVDVESYVAWKNGKFVFEKESLNNIMNRLERWYDLTVFFQNETVKNKRFSLRIDRYGNISDILEKLEQTTDIQFVVKNNKTVLVREI
jgi:ferric-dicitrate binding protein FerR (iron transport regulator)